MPELVSLLVSHKRLYQNLHAAAQLKWHEHVVEPFKVLISIGVMIFVFTLGLFSPIILLLAPLITTSYYWHGPVLAYLIWFLYDYRTPRNGIGRLSGWLRSLYIFKLAAEYFSMKCIRLGTSQQLDPNKNYVLGFHPHGNAPMGCLEVFASDAVAYHEMFPHHDRHLFIHPVMFIIPFAREALIAMGCHTVDRPVMDKVIDSYADESESSKTYNHLSERKRKSLFVIVPGGIDEMFKTRPGVIDLTLRNRKGFVRQAIRHGADLIPVLSLGENELWHIYVPSKGSIWYKIQKFARDYINGFSLNYPIGVGLTTNSRGILPARSPITVVTGNVIPVVHEHEPPQETVDRIHKQYIEELERMFEEVKDKYAPPGYQLIIN